MPHFINFCALFIYGVGFLPGVWDINILQLYCGVVWLPLTLLGGYQSKLLLRDAILTSSRRAVKHFRISAFLHLYIAILDVSLFSPVRGFCLGRIECYLGIRRVQTVCLHRYTVVYNMITGSKIAILGKYDYVTWHSALGS